MAGVCFAGFLTIFGAGLGEEEGARRAVYAFAFAIPVLCTYVVFAEDDPSRHHYSRLMQWIPIGGAMLGLAGLSLMFEQAAPGSGLLLFFGTIACVWMFVRAEDRAKRRQSRKRDSLN